MENAEAGPSNASTSHPQIQSSSQSKPAPLRPLPSMHFYSIEYPGYVKSTSVPLALERLGGQANIEAAFKRGGNKSECALELSMKPGNPFTHPIPGEVLPASNILLKVSKRRLKKKNSKSEIVGEYKIEAVGVVAKSARFRSMADYQYNANMNDAVSQLRTSMDMMDVEGILKYRIPEEKEDYTVIESEDGADMDTDIDPQLVGEKESSKKIRSNLRLLPPPIFSRQNVPQLYNFKTNPASVLTAVIDEETGEEKKRLINRMRWKGYGPIAINFSDKDVPDKPSDTIEAQRAEADSKLLARLQELFEQRPVWTRTAIFNQLSAHEVREVLNTKYMLPLVSYVFQDGPWRDTQVRLGYDPREDPEARFYQRVYFRNVNHPITRPSVVNRRQEARSDVANARVDSTEDKRSHIFDGQTMSKETAAYQLCDLHDLKLKEMVENEEDLRDTCNERDGWFTTHAFERIKAVLRLKFFSLLSGHIATDQEVENLLQGQTHAEKPKVTHRVRPSKHNMAKGALREEDAAAMRLTAILDQQAKNFASQRKPKAT
ncbi:RNA polymerase III transcription factor IIIC subunit-domain-containing protein [Irpex rosettiformis]|uniref:RNA polymerase III transcription factor IIIC subunit-domain-containing protein n=1 Tax=Irpex rosettiformis TaxID=378272 RepID=A0ACB8UEB1_9APHY|nr:RNA polymerase III transcription factor IIIC subunit-domain-containing protein [Irpex rosettiformis]